MFRKMLTCALVLSLALTLCFGVASAADRSTTVTGGQYDKLAIGVSSDPQDLRPFDPNAGSRPYIYFNFYECLFDLENNEYIPALAKGYTEVDDTHWQVEIYDYIYDTDGNHITADDVVYSYEILIESGFAIKYGAYEGIKKIDDYTVEFTWTAPIDSVGVLEFPWCRTFIVSQKAYEEGNFATAPVGTGPYKVTSFVSGSHVNLEATGNYWQTDESKVSQRHKANVKNIEYHVIAESAQHVIALQTGDIDFSQYIPDENVKDFENNDAYDVFITQGSRTWFLSPSTLASSPCSDINFRKAVFHAIDNNACATATGGTIAAKAVGSSFFGDYVPAWGEEDNYVTTFGPELSKQLLAETGYKGEAIKLLYANEETYKNLATIVQAFLMNVGINVQLDSVEYAQIGNVATEEGRWDILLHDLGGGSQIGMWNRLLNREEFANNMAMGFIDDDTLQTMYKDAMKVINYGPEAMTGLHNYIIENAYADSLVSAKLNMVFSSDIANVYLRENAYLLPGACDYYLD